jgi:membrane protein YdbS with pleckstrin-like domain
VKKTIRPTVYDSAIDLWVAALILLSPLASAVIGVYLLIQGQADGAMYLFLVGAGSLILTVAFTHPCRYTILEDSLSIRCGILFYQIPLSEIESVEPSGSWLSAPALSLRRVKIRSARRTILVSPRAREEFIEELRKAAATNHAE